MSHVFNAYAPPMIWGAWAIIASHTASIGYDISASAVGDTRIRCRVRYFKEIRNQVIEEFVDLTSIRTANVIANIEVSFMGVPLGSAVDGTISP
jgi:hypothetical protein